MADDHEPITILHKATEMTSVNDRLRWHCWWQIPLPVLSRLYELGTDIDWWAAPDPRHPTEAPRAVILGGRGVYFADPHVKKGMFGKPKKQPAYEIFGYDIVSGSGSVDEVVHRPARDDEQPTATVGAETASADSDVPDIGLRADIKGILGNLPPRAQQLLQAPFTTERRVDHQESYYMHYSSYSFTTIALFLIGGGDLTMATGRKVIPYGHGDATAHWSLQIHRALVTVHPTE